MYPLRGLLLWPGTIATPQQLDPTIPDDTGYVNQNAPPPDKTLVAAMASGYLSIADVSTLVPGDPGYGLAEGTQVYKIVGNPPLALGKIPLYLVELWPIGDTEGKHVLINPKLVAIDKNYGQITLKANVRALGTVADKIGNAVIAVTASTLGGLVPGGSLFIAASNGQPITALGVASAIGGQMDFSDFTSVGDALVNNAPGFASGAVDPYAVAFPDSAFAGVTDTTTLTVADMTGNTDGPALAFNSVDQGVLDPTLTGNNVLGDPANLTTEPYSPDQGPNLGNTPKGGGLNSTAPSGSPALLPSSPKVVQPLPPIPYLPSNPRYLQTPQQFTYNPIGGGLFPIINPTGNTGATAPYGTGGQPGVTATAQATPSILGNSSTMLLIGGAVVLAILLLKG